MQPTRGKLIKENSASIPYIWHVSKRHKMVLLCLHGFAGDKDSSVIAALLEGLDETGVGVVSFDWPAHGESPASDHSLTVENALADLSYVIGWIKSQVSVPIACFATSFGGYLAILFRNQNPDAFFRLTLRSPALNMKEVFRRLLTDNEYELIIRGETVEMGFERKMQIGKPFFKSLCRNDAFALEPPRPEEILVLQGDKDLVVDPSDTKNYTQINGIKLVLFEATDHYYKRPGEKERIVSVTKDYLEESGLSRNRK